MTLAPRFAYLLIAASRALPSLGKALSITPALLSTTLPGLFSSPIATPSTPQAPSPRRLSTSNTAIPTQRSSRPEQLFAPLQQTMSLSRAAPTPRLTCPRFDVIFNWAHGRYNSRGSSLGAGRLLRSETPSLIPFSRHDRRTKHTRPTLYPPPLESASPSPTRATRRKRTITQWSSRRRGSGIPGHRD